MYKFHLNGTVNKHEYEEVIKTFLPVQEFQVLTDEELSDDAISVTYKGDKNALKREIYQELSRLTGKQPEWGILTGIRPVKMTGELFDKGWTESMVRRCLLEDFLIHPKKVDLLLQIYAYQYRMLGKPKLQEAGIYIGIPFCPTRCWYCSFTSNQVTESEVERYLSALKQEIAYVGTQMTSAEIRPETIYIGGGTPTHLTAAQLKELLFHLNEAFDFSRVKEITVEAGRPDTIDQEKLDIITYYGVSRISINPQTMKDETLQRIGRDHDADRVRQAFGLVRQAGIPVINADIIAGLPGETMADFKETLRQVIALGANNITVHTLAVKRSSRLKDEDVNYHFRHMQLVEEMIQYARERLFTEGYKPYYLYKQKNTAPNTENIGYCKEETLGIYNVRIMAENQPIIALGAGAISKAYYPAENRLERVPNVSNYEIYIERIDEMLKRKRDNLF